MATIEEWNERHRSGDMTDRRPTSVVVRATMLSTPGRALDVACGTGRNAVFLAENGWEVIAIDGAVEALRRLNENAERDRLSIDTALVDLENEPLAYGPGSFDLIVITHYLQRDLFVRAATLLRTGGHCAVAIKLAAGSTDAPKHRYRVAPGELRDLFDAWNVIDYREENGVAEIIARRPAVLS